MPLNAAPVAVLMIILACSPCPRDVSMMLTPVLWYDKKRYGGVPVTVTVTVTAMATVTVVTVVTVMGEVTVSVIVTVWWR